MNPLTLKALMAIVGISAYESGKAGLSYLINIFKNINNHAVVQSLATMSKPLQVEPLCIIDSNLRTSESLPDIQQSVLSLFAGFYVQSVAVTMANKEVEIMSKVGHLGTKTGPTLTQQVIQESAKVFKSTFDKEQTSVLDTGALSNGTVLATEDYTPSNISALTASLDKANYNLFTKQMVNTSLEGKDDSSNYLVNSIKELKEDSRLSVGKMVGIVIRDKRVDDSGKVHTVEVQVPVLVRLMNGYLRSDQIVEFFAMKDMSAMERAIAHKTGKLSLFKDIVLCWDVYKQFRRNLVKDKSGMFKSTIDKKSQTSIDQMRLGNSRSTGITNNMICTNATTKAIEDKLRISLNNYKQRNEFFITSSIMTYVDVNENYRMVTIYFHGVDRPMELSFNDLKKASGKDPNIADIVQALSLGQPPRLY